MPLEPKAQLVNPQGPLDVDGVNATGITTATGGFVGQVQGAATGLAATTYNIQAGIITATRFIGDVTGTASSLAQGANITVGVMTASSFVGDLLGNATGLTTTTSNLNLGIVTSTGFRGNFTGLSSGLSGTPNIQTGIVTATKFLGNSTGTVVDLADDTNINVGIITATKFEGNTTGSVTKLADDTNINVGIITASKFVGNANGSVTGLADDTNINVATFTGTQFIGNTPGTAADLANGTNLTVGTFTGTKFIGNTPGSATKFADDINVNAGTFTASRFVGNTPGSVTGIADDTNLNMGTLTATQFIGNTPGLAAGISAGKNLAAGIVTATTFYGDGSGITGAGVTGYIRQSVTAQAGTTTINLNDGNIIYLTHSNNTTIAFSNVPTATRIGIIRTLTNNTITWPAAIVWNNSSAPTLLGANSRTPDAAQVFSLITYNGGTTWYGYEEMSNNPIYWTGFYVFGNNADGVFGNNNETDSTGNDSLPSMSPIEAFQSANITKYSAINGSQNRIMAINDADKSLWAVGNAEYWGQLGLNTRDINYSSPTQVPGTNWRSVYVGVRGGIATKTDGTLWMWGHNEQGDLGQGNTTSHSSPVQVGSGTDWAGGPRAISFSTNHTTAIKTDGTLWIWGANERGQLGQNDLSEYNSPVQVPGTNWSKAEARGRWTIALKSDNTLWSWGYGAFGKLGLNVAGGGPGAQSSRSSPSQIPGNTWRSFDRHTAHSNADATFATKTDGTLWAWGYNQTSGLLGQNNRTDYSSPKQIGSDTTWGAACSVNSFYGAAMIKTDGTLWGIGQTSLKKADNSTTWNKFSSPIQIGSGTDWDTSDGRVINSGSSWISVQSI